MKIFMLASDGSPIGVTMKTLMGTDPIQVGCGGSECAMLTLCEAWHNRGDDVCLFNDPRETNASPFEQRSIASFDPDERCDVLIILRSPNPRVVGANAGLKVWLSHDQQTTGGFAQFRSLVDKVVVISPRHRDFFQQAYGINDAIPIDIPIRVWEYEGKNIEKVKNRFIFTSVPARGLDVMLEIWPQIRKEIPDASLVITSDYRLWGVNCGRGNEQFVAKAFGLDGIIFLSAIPRPRLVGEQLRAELNVYTNLYDELFCLAIAESQVAGAYPITSDIGALVTTNMGTIIPGNPKDVEDKYIKFSVSILDKIHSGEVNISDLQRKAIERFHPNRILEEWDTKVFK